MQQTLANRLVLPSSSDNPREQTRIREFPKRLLNTLSSFLQLPATIYTYIFFKYILYISTTMSCQMMILLLLIIKNKNNK